MSEQQHSENTAANGADTAPAKPARTPRDGSAAEIGGRGGLEPTRYGDWEKNGRCIDF